MKHRIMNWLQRKARRVLPGTRGPVGMAIILLAAACDDSPLEPASPVNGEWTYSALVGHIDQPEPQPGQAECTVSDATMNLASDPHGFSGDIEGGVVCIVIGNSNGASMNGRVTNGQLTGEHVQFTIGNWQCNGVLSGDTMSGTMTMRIEIDGLPVDLTGEWTAERL
jgi:hypothetical protein